MESTNNKTVLVIEDDADMGYTLVVALQAAGLTVLAASDGKSGLATALSERPDVIVLDLKLPKLSGQNLLAKLREDSWGAHVPVLILTNEDDAQTIADSLEHSAQGYFIKADTDLDTIVASVQDLLRRR